MKIYRYDRVLPDVRKKLEKMLATFHILSLNVDREAGFIASYYLLPMRDDGFWIFLAVGYNFNKQCSVIHQVVVVGTADEIDWLIDRRLNRGFELMTHGKMPQNMPRLIAHMLAQELES